MNFFENFKRVQAFQVFKNIHAKNQKDPLKSEGETTISHFATFQQACFISAILH